jgi:ketosteroid isomerase-like protein
MTLTYAFAHDLLEAYCRTRMTYDGDGFTDLFAEAAEVSLDPFSPPLVGHNALRAYLLEAAEAERYYDVAIERHWVAGDTALAAWHASWNRVTGDVKLRQAGFLSAEVGEDGRIGRLKMWTVTREHLAGQEGA